MPQPTLTLLQTFIAVAQHGSVHRAAAALRLSQASASRHLLQLEQVLGAELFVRRVGRPLELTPAGGRLLDASQELVHDVTRRWGLLRSLAVGDVPAGADLR